MTTKYFNINNKYMKVFYEQNSSCAIEIITFCKIHSVIFSEDSNGNTFEKLSKEYIILIESDFVYENVRTFINQRFTYLEPSSYDKSNITIEKFIK